jgi:hypothetical protein
MQRNLHPAVHDFHILASIILYSICCKLAAISTASGSTYKIMYAGDGYDLTNALQSGHQDLGPDKPYSTPRSLARRSICASLAVPWPGGKLSSPLRALTRDRSRSTPKYPNQDVKHYDSLIFKQ